MRTGILLTAFGGPHSLDEVAPFMENLMGREPSDEAVARARRKYLAIGGASPLPTIAEEIITALSERFGPEVVIGCGMRYWHPSIAETLERMVASDVGRVVTLSLSPFESKVATGEYRKALAEARAGLPEITLVEAPGLGTLEGYADFFAMALMEALEELANLEADDPLVVFTAHSLPVEDLGQDDPYVAGLEDVAAAVARARGLDEGMRLDGTGRLGGIRAFGNLDGAAPWVLCYQSKGNRPGEWVGPSLDEVIDAAAQAGFGAIVAVPIGFATDHMETRYDLDVEAADKVLNLEMEWVRAEVPNATTNIIDVMESALRPLLG